MEERLTAPARPWLQSFERGTFLLLLGGTLYAAWRTARPVLLVLLVAAAVATLTSGLLARLTVACRGRRRLAALFSTAIVLGGFLAPLVGFLIFVGQRLVGEVSQLAGELERDAGATVGKLAAHLGALGPPLQRSAGRIGPELSRQAPLIAQRFAEVAATVGAALLQILIGLFLLTISLYYFYVNGPAWRERIVRLVPLPADEVRGFFTRFHQASVGVFVGSLGSALIQGVVATLGYALLGAPVPVVWGIATAFAALVPGIGSALAWVPLAVITAGGHGWLRGAGVAIYGALIISTVDNVVRPWIARRALDVHPLFTFVAVFGGFAAYGPSGIFLGPLVVALGVTVLDLYERRLRGGVN